MVTETLTQPEIDEEESTGDAGFDLDLEQPVDGATEDENVAETEQEFDAQAAINALQERLENQSKALDPSKVNSALGRVASIQSMIDRLAQQNPLEQVNPRIQQLEEALDDVLSLLSTADLLDDTSRAKIAERTKAREESRLEERVAERLRKETQREEDPSTAVIQQQWVQAQQELVKYATKRGVDPASIPANVVAEANNTGSPVLGTSIIQEWIDEQAKAVTEDTQTVERVATRKTAAGKGAPARSGGTRSLEDIEEVYGNGGSITDEELAILRRFHGL